MYVYTRVVSRVRKRRIVEKRDGVADGSAVRRRYLAASRRPETKQRARLCRLDRDERSARRRSSGKGAIRRIDGEGQGSASGRTGRLWRLPPDVVLYDASAKASRLLRRLRRLENKKKKTPQSGQL